MQGCGQKHCCKLEVRKLGLRGAAGSERISWEQLLCMMWLCKSQGTFNGIAQAFVRLPSMLKRMPSEKGLSEAHRCQGLKSLFDGKRLGEQAKFI